MSTSPRQPRTSVAAPPFVHSASSLDAPTCTNPRCPFRELIRDEELRCSRLGAANQVLRDAQQFLLAKCEAAAEHSNMLSFELDALRKEREELFATIRSERIHFEEQREDLNRRWDHISEVENSLAGSRKQVLIAQQENSLLKDQLCSLQDAVNKLTERLALATQQNRQRTPEKRLVAAPTQSVRAEDRPDSAGRRGTPPRGRSGERRTNQPGRHFGTLRVDPSGPMPVNFYDSPNHRNLYQGAVGTTIGNQQSPNNRSPTEVDRNESEPRHQIGWSLAADAEGEATPPPPPPPQEASMHHHTPENRSRSQQQQVWHTTSVSPAPLPSPLTEYTRSMKAALERADYVSAGLSASLPRLSGRAPASEQATGAKRGTAASAFMEDYESYIRSHPLIAAAAIGEEEHSNSHHQAPQPPVKPPPSPTAADRPRSPLLQRTVEPLRRYDVDGAGVSATVALKKFRESTQSAFAPSIAPASYLSEVNDDVDRDDSNSPPPPPPPETLDEVVPNQPDSVSESSPARSTAKPLSARSPRRNTTGSGNRPTTAVNSTLEMLGLPLFRTDTNHTTTRRTSNDEARRERASFGGNRNIAAHQTSRGVQGSSPPSFDER